MASAVVLDACVLYPMPVCDTLLRLADAGLYRPVWSSAILEELHRVFIRNGRTGDSAISRIARMNSAFPGTLTDDFELSLARVPGAVDPGDAHVVALAFASGSQVIVTDNTRHFAPSVLANAGIRVLDADTFLSEHLHFDAVAVARVLEEQATELASPITVAALLDRFPNASGFVREARKRLLEDPEG